MKATDSSVKDIQKASPSFVRILVTILSVSILPVLIISFLLNHLAFSYTRQNYLLTVSKNLATFSASLDESIRGVEKLIAVAGSNGDVISFVVDPDKDNYSRNSRIIDVLNSFVASYEFISSIYLYSATEGIILASNGGVKSLTEFSDTGWVDPFNRHFLGVNRLATRFVQDKNSKNLSVISLLANLPLGSWDKSAGLIVNINREQLFSNYHNLLESGHLAYVLNDRGYLLDHPDSSRVGNFAGDDPVLQAVQDYDSGYFVRKVDGKNRVIAFASAPYTRWAFVSRVELGDLLLLERRMLVINSVIILLAVSSILVLVIRISRGVYLPIQKLDNSTRQLENAQPVMKANVLHHLLTNKLNGEEDFRSSLELIGVQFTAARYIALVIGIDHYRRIVRSKDQVSLRLLKNALRERIETYVPAGIPNICAEREGGHICLLLNTGMVDAETQKMVRSIARNVQSAAVRDFPFTVTCGIGNIQSSLRNAYLSYNEALTATGFRFYDGGGTIIEYAHIESKVQECFISRSGG